MPLSSYHPSSTGVLPHPAAAAAAACMHPAFNYMFNRPETTPKSSVINHQTNYFNPHQQPSARNREVSASSTSSSSSSSSSFCPDVTSGSFQYLISQIHLPSLFFESNAHKNLMCFTR